MEPQALTFQDLQKITDDFSKERKIGEGTFGAVYKVRSDFGKLIFHIYIKGTHCVCSASVRC